MKHFKLSDGFYLLYIPDVNISKFSKLSDNLSSMTVQLMVVIVALIWIFEVKLFKICNFPRSFKQIKKYKKCLFQYWLQSGLGEFVIQNMKIY